MKHIILGLLACAYSMAATAQPICRITHYDEFSGMSQRLVKQAVQDNAGMMWFATWNGLNRFDGYDFTTVKTRPGDGNGIYSDRINDIKLMSTGNLWCRVDKRCVIFNVSTYRFVDFLPAIERKMKRRFEITRLLPAEDGTTVMECADGTFLTVGDANPAATARLSHSLPAKRYRRHTNRQYESIGGFKGKELIYSCADKYGTIWVITRNGDIYHTTDPSMPLTLYPGRISSQGTLYYTTTDRQGNVWLRSSYGVYKLVFGRYPCHAVPQHQVSQVRCLYKDRRGRIWMTGRDDGTIRLFDGNGKELGYLGKDGVTHRQYTRFGASVYCMTEDSRRQIWLGTKPDGLFRLTEQADGRFIISNYRHRNGDAASLSCDNIYDLAADSRGRLWIATMGGGLNCIEDTGSGSPAFLNAGNGINGYPKGGMSVRRILITSGGVMMLATTGGLVVADSKAGSVRKMSFRLHTGEADRMESLGNVALMDVMEDSRRRVFVAAESGGISQVTTRDLLAQTLDFKHFNIANGLASDIALSLTEYKGRLWVVSNNCIMALNPDNGASAAYSSNYWKHKLRFSDAHPLQIDKGRWMFGLQDGCMTINLDSMGSGCYIPEIALTAISIQNRKEDFAVNSMDTLVLQPDERNITIKFAALDYADAPEISYAFRMGGDGEWNNVGKTRSVTLLDMEPGTYRLMIRSTDSNGKWLDNTRTLTIIVTPAFYETKLAYLIYLLTISVIVFAIIRTVSYIRSIRRKQRETLEAYLKLLDEKQKETGGIKDTEERAEDGKPALEEEDEQMMKRVMEFVEAHICDSDVSITDMASAAAVSKSGLNRKMKSILGVPPAEFLRETRIQRAATLLATTNKPVSDIALECGFADQNYFAKCFKARRGIPPSEFRKQGQTAL